MAIHVAPARLADRRTSNRGRSGSCTSITTLASNVIIAIVDAIRRRHPDASIVRCNRISPSALLPGTLGQNFTNKKRNNATFSAKQIVL